MTKVDFYVLSETTSEARWLFACKLTEKVQKMGMRVLLAVDSEIEAQKLDELLWTFKPESFVPHQVINGLKPAPVEITYSEQVGDHQGLLLNLTSTIPSWFSRFERVCEVVIQEPEMLATSRERYSYYKTRGYPIQTHKL